MLSAPARKGYRSQTIENEAPIERNEAPREQNAPQIEAVRTTPSRGRPREKGIPAGLDRATEEKLARYGDPQIPR